MNRRNFLANMGLGALALTIPSIASASPLGDRIITANPPNTKFIRLLKNGQMLGVVYWANLDTKQYRRSALWMDFFDGPWEGEGRIVRHPEHTGKHKITFGPMMRADRDMSCDLLGVEYSAHEPAMVSYSYSIDQYPVVDYPGWVVRNTLLNGDSQNTCLTVEGTFDEAVLSINTPPEIRALYPDLKVK